jgi:general stress protein YciG
MAEKPKSKRGFASMSLEKRQEIASKGGQSVRKENRSFSRDRELASTSGRKGGTAVSAENRAFSKDRALAKSAGKLGGVAASSRKVGGPKP